MFSSSLGLWDNFFSAPFLERIGLIFYAEKSSFQKKNFGLAPERGDSSISAGTKAEFDVNLSENAGYENVIMSAAGIFLNAGVCKLVLDKKLCCIVLQAFFSSFQLHFRLAKNLCATFL